MIDKDIYDCLRKRFGKYSSWAIWSEPGITVKSNTSDLSVFDSGNILNELKTDYVFVGLNVSRDECGRCWSNFHSPSPAQNDYKLRYAFHETVFWGSYMTDVIKDCPEPDSRKIMKDIRGRKGAIDINESITTLKSELELLGEPKVIAFGNAVYELLTTYLPSYEVFKLKHYSSYCSKEKYRGYVESLIKNNNFVG